jgi:hypothetical protein
MGQGNSSPDDGKEDAIARPRSAALAAMVNHALSEPEPSPRRFHQAFRELREMSFGLFQKRGRF